MSNRGLLLLCLLILAAGETQARPGLAPPKILNLEPITGWVELGVRGRNNRRTRSDSDTTFDQEDLKLDEILHANIDGYFLYSRLARFHAGAELHFLQNLTTGQNQILPRGDFRLNFLEKKPYGLSLFALIRDDEVQESFGRSFETRVESYGSSLRVGLGPLPFRLRYTHRIRDRSGDSEANAREEGDELDFLGNYRLSEGSDGDVRFVFSDATERGQKSVRHEVVVNNVTYFDSKQRKRFTGHARYYDWSGQSDNSSASIFGNYNWQHTDRVSSSYQANFQHRTFGSRTTDLYDANVSVSHRLYSSLDSTLILSGNFQDASFGDIGETGAMIHENYTKQLGGWGRLGIGLSPYTRVRFTRPSEDTAFVTGERVVVPDIVPVELRQQDIDTSIIVVTSTDGAITYQEGIDYTIRVIGRRTEIERILSGTIPAGGLVLIDYEYALEGENDLVSYGYRGDVTLWYQTWGRVFGKFSSQREDVVSGFTDRRLDDRDEYEVGLRMRQRWFSAVVSFDWERESFRPSNGTLQAVSFSTPWPGKWRGSMGVTHSTRDYRDPDEKVDRWRLHGRLTFQFGSSGLFEIEPEYRNEDWRGGNSADARDLEAAGATTSVRWSFRAIELKMGASVFSMDRVGTEELRYRYNLQVRRHF
jgi:hypothetical protein